MGLSSYLLDKFLNHHFKGTAAGTAPTTLYGSIHSADPLLTGVNEVTATYFSGRASTLLVTLAPLILWVIIGKSLALLR